MKYSFLLWLLFLVIKSYSQNLKEGDNIKTEFKKITKRYYFEAPPFTEWIEGKDILLIGNKPNATECSYLFIATTHDTTLIGVFKQAEPSGFMFDDEGNSILGKQIDYFLLPIWIVKNKTKISSSDTTIVSLLDKLYNEMLQPDDYELNEATVKKYGQYRTDTSLANRHIALLFDSYQTIITNVTENKEKYPAEILVPLMGKLADECTRLYHKIPVIICIYMGETLLNAGMEQKAREHFKMAIQIYPNSIPLQVYDYKLEQDAAKKQEKLNQLKKKHPKHWMVKVL
jgi:hypothetical protein